MPYDRSGRWVPETMGDITQPRTYTPRGVRPTIIDPNDPRLRGGVAPVPGVQTPPRRPTTAAAPPPRDLAAEQAAWDAEYRALPPGGTMNRQRPGTEGSVDPRYATPDSGYGQGGVSNPAYTSAPPPPPGVTPQKRSHSYTGGALAYYGTGDIDGADDVVGGTHASTGVNTAGWQSKERGSNSIKNTAIKIATRYPPKPSSIDLWLADPDTKRFFPNAKKVGFDKVDFGDGKAVDILKNADPNSDSAEAWAWMPDDESVPDGAGTGMANARTAAASGSGTSTSAPTEMDDFAYERLAERRAARLERRGQTMGDLMPRER